MGVLWPILFRIRRPWKRIPISKWQDKTVTQITIRFPLPLWGIPRANISEEYHLKYLVKTFKLIANYSCVVVTFIKGKLSLLSMKQHPDLELKIFSNSVLRNWKIYPKRGWSGKRQSFWYDGQAYSIGHWEIWRWTWNLFLLVHVVNRVYLEGPCGQWWTEKLPF